MQNVNVIEFVEFLKEVPAIVMELAEGGNLHNYLLNQSEPIGNVLRMKWCMQLTDAVAYLHHLGICHSISFLSLSFFLFLSL